MPSGPNRSSAWRWRPTLPPGRAALRHPAPDGKETARRGGERGPGGNLHPPHRRPFRRRPGRRTDRGGRAVEGEAADLLRERVASRGPAPPPRPAWVRLLLARSRRRKDYPEGLREAESILAAADAELTSDLRTYGQRLLLRGLLLTAQKRHRAAATALREYLEPRPGNAEGALALAEAHRATGEPDREAAALSLAILATKNSRAVWSSREPTPTSGPTGSRGPRRTAGTCSARSRTPRRRSCSRPGSSWLVRRRRRTGRLQEVYLEPAANRPRAPLSVRLLYARARHAAGDPIGAMRFLAETRERARGPVEKLAVLELMARLSPEKESDPYSGPSRSTRRASRLPAARTREAHPRRHRGKRQPAGDPAPGGGARPRRRPSRCGAGSSTPTCGPGRKPRRAARTRSDRPGGWRSSIRAAPRTSWSGGAWPCATSSTNAPGSSSKAGPTSTPGTRARRVPGPGLPRHGGARPGARGGSSGRPDRPGTGRGPSGAGHGGAPGGREEPLRRRAGRGRGPPARRRGRPPRGRPPTAWAPGARLLPGGGARGHRCSRGGPEGVREALEQQETEDPDRVAATLLLLGNIARTQRDVPALVGATRRHVEIEPENPTAWVPAVRRPGAGGGRRRRGGGPRGGERAAAGEHAGGLRGGGGAPLGRAERGGAAGRPGDGAGRPGGRARTPPPRAHPRPTRRRGGRRDGVYRAALVRSPCRSPRRPGAAERAVAGAAAVLACPLLSHVCGLQKIHSPLHRNRACR